MNQKKHTSSLGLEKAEILIDIAQAMQKALTTYLRVLCAELSNTGFQSVTPAQLTVLGRIPTEGISNVELANILNKSKQAVGKTVSELEQNKFVSYRGDATDKRKQIVTITGTGKKLITKAKQIQIELGEKASMDISKSDLQTISLGLKKLSNTFLK